ncbi:M1 family metallopeptidase [Negadavirga shengliensis]|uniref:M1 family metallopeptidase n=1 Tax=Negadavirga shengliensis TaxID=1389218 RepID=A0ABV9SX84_9BACT
MYQKHFCDVQKGGIILLFLLIWVAGREAVAQTEAFSRQDSLRGSITPEREWWDLDFYHLEVRVDPDKKTIEGKNTVHYTAIQEGNTLQIDLQEPMKIRGFSQNGKSLKFKNEGSAYFVKLEEPQHPGESHRLEIEFGGKPKISPNPPWSGGITWSKDKNGLPFVANSNQGDGASLWWPCKDHMYDQPDSMAISVRVPEPLMNVSNGRLRDTEKHDDGTRTFHWFVSNPISNYVVNISIGDYAHFSEDYLGEKGMLTMDYFVLKDNLEVAKTHFKDAPKMMRAFEYWFGPYPFYEDGFKLIEVPYLGMEHQSAVTYGNGYVKGYKGKDFSETGWGMTFDYIIIHESGHEWFANNITYKDIADMWIHESFTTYSEAIFLDYHYGKKASSEYIIGARRVIKNDIPIIGVYDVNQRGSGDMYFKGANILHTLRTWVNDDEKWRNSLRRMNEVFYHQTVTTVEIEHFWAEETGLDLKPFFDQYLRTAQIPQFEYEWEDGRLKYRWGNVVEGFEMPLKILDEDKETWLDVTGEWQTTELILPGDTFTVDPNFYIDIKNNYN